MTICHKKYRSLIVAIVMIIISAMLASCTDNAGDGTSGTTYASDVPGKTEEKSEELTVPENTETEQEEVTAEEEEDIPEVVWSMAEHTKETDIVIPDGVTKIEGHNESSCAARSITIPESVRVIGDRAFAYCGDLREISLPSKLKTIGENAFRDCNLKSVKLPDGLKSIGAFAFSGTNLESITIPDSVTSIGSGAFMGCTRLTEAVLPAGLTEIKARTFMFCGELEGITIPGKVTCIEAEAFLYCGSIEDVNVDPDNKVYYSENDCLIEKATGRLILGGQTTVIPSGVRIICGGAFNSRSFIGGLSIPDTVTTIESGAFYMCTGPSSLTVPASVINMGEDALDLYDVKLINIKGRTSIPDTWDKNWYRWDAKIQFIQ